MPWPFSPLVAGAGGIDVDEADVAGPAQDEVGDGRVVDHRIGIRLHDDRGHPARRRGARRRLQGLLGFRPGLAGLDPQVDEAGTEQGAVGVDDPHVGGKTIEPALPTHLADQSAIDQKRTRSVVAGVRIDQAGVDESDRARAHRLSSRAASEASTAMRAATPIST